MIHSVDSLKLAREMCIRDRLYSGYRHEIHNYPDLKTEVMWSLAEFYNNVLGCGFESMMEKYTS